MPVIVRLIFAKVKTQKWMFLLKAIAIAICSVFFFGNNFVIFQQFISHKSYYASKLNYENELLLPNIVLCNSSAFKNQKVPTLDLGHYLSNTLQLSDALLSITSGYAGSHASSGVEKTLWNATYNSEHIQIKPVLTYYRGRCFMIKYKQMVG